MAVAVVWPLWASAQTSARELEDKRTSFGAFAAPAVLPSGSTAAYGYAGFPEIGAGYRQGLGPMELDTRLTFNWWDVKFAVEAIGKFPVYRDDKLQVAPSLGVGLAWDTGAQYLNEDNFDYLGLRLIPGASLSYRIAETASLIGELEVPVDITLTEGGGSWVTPLIGGGGELYIGDDLTAGAVMQFGVDVSKDPLRGVTDTRFAFALRVGIGYRFF